MRYHFLFILLWMSSYAQAQSAYEHPNDSIAIAKVSGIDPIKSVLEFEQKRSEQVAYHYHFHTQVLVYRKPDNTFNYYWVQVTHDRNVEYNFYVDPKTWAVNYYDTASHNIWTLQEWGKRRNERKRE